MQNLSSDMLGIISKFLFYYEANLSELLTSISLKIIRKPQKTYGFLMISGGIKLIRLIIEAKFGDDFIDLLNDIVVVITVVVIATTPQCCKINIAQPFQVGY